MDDYNRYVTAVNKIFDYVEKMKAGWNNMDNRNYIESIDEYKSVVTAKASAIRKPPTVKVEKAGGGEETLSIDFDDDDSGVDSENFKDEEEAPKKEEASAPAVAASQSEIRTFSPSHQSQPVSMAIPELPQMGGFKGIKEAAKIPSVEAMPIPKVPSDM